MSHTHARTDGVRAGAKRLGRKNPRSSPPRRRSRSRSRSPPPPPYMTRAASDSPYIPPKQPYELAALVVDLVLLARYLLRPQGLLVFFLPTVTESYDEIDVRTALCDGMELVANSLQDFGNWGRRVRSSPPRQTLSVRRLIRARPPMITSSSPFANARPSHILHPSLMASRTRTSTCLHINTLEPSISRGSSQRWTRHEIHKDR